MDQALNNVFTYSNYLRGYFFKDSTCTYNFQITQYNNESVKPDENSSLTVSIDFVPDEFVEYEFNVIEATSSYLHLANGSNMYFIGIVDKKNTSTNTEPDTCSQFERDLYVNNSNITDVIDYDSTQQDQELDEPDDYYYWSENEEDGYDSEDYYFRVRW